jgi:hypothetical protein
MHAGGLGKMPGIYFTVESGAQAHLAARLTRAVEKVGINLSIFLLGLTPAGCKHIVHLMYHQCTGCLRLLIAWCGWGILLLVPLHHGWTLMILDYHAVVCRPCRCQQGSGW